MVVVSRLRVVVSTYRVVVSRYKPYPTLMTYPPLGNDYDILSTPVSLDKGKYQFGDEDTHIKQGSRLFFAGEHTIRNYPATVSYLN